VIVPFGAPGAGRSIPIPGDYDGSGRVELAVYMPALGLFAYRPANGGPDVVVPFGAANSGSVPVVGDYDGSGRADLAVFDPTRALFAYRPANAPDVLVNFGTAGPGGSLPVAAPPATATPGGTVSAIGSPTPATTKAVPRGPSAVVSTRGLRPSRVAQSTPSANRTTGT